MKRAYAVIYLDDLHIRYFDTKEETTDAVEKSLSLQTLALRYYPSSDSYSVMEQLNLS